MLLKYTSQIVNLANNNAQSTRPKHVGQMSELIQEYRRTTTTPTVEGWKTFYKSAGYAKADVIAARKTYAMLVKMRENLAQVTEEDVLEWMRDLLGPKTFQGLGVQPEILRQIAKRSWRLSSPDEEAKGIDGIVDGEPVSIKPVSYKQTVVRGTERIPYRIIYYTKRNGKLTIVE